MSAIHYYTQKHEKIKEQCALRTANLGKNYLYLIYLDVNLAFNFPLVIECKI